MKKINNEDEQYNANASYPTSMLSQLHNSANMFVGNDKECESICKFKTKQNLKILLLSLLSLHALPVRKEQYPSHRDFTTFFNLFLIGHCLQISLRLWFILLYKCF